MSVRSGFFTNIKKPTPVRVAVPCAENAEAIEALAEAQKEGFLETAFLFGDINKVKEIAANSQLDLSGVSLTECSDAATAAHLAAKAIAVQDANLLLKGQIDTKTYLKAVLDRSLHLVEEHRILSHVAILDIPGRAEPLFFSDAAIHISPSVDEKVQILKNCAEVAFQLGISPKIALIAAAEKVNPKMQSTTDAVAVLQKLKSMPEGTLKAITQYCEGPYDLYIALSSVGAQIKEIHSEVAGKANVLIFPEINSANVFYKTMQLFCPGVRLAAFVAGSIAPIILPSRADSAETKFLSLKLAAHCSLNAQQSTIS